MANDTEELDKIIYGRWPHIYAFSTNTIPNYWKVGDTSRSVSKRLEEWERDYPDLKKEFEGSAKVEGEEIYFRDYSVHHYLEDELGKRHLEEDDLKKMGAPAGTHYSSEFFKNIGKPDLEDAIKDINEYYKKTEKGDWSEYRVYTYYKIQDEVPKQTGDIEPIEDYVPRKNQQDVIDKFTKAVAVANGRKNLLMYAVMRFGKSFTAMRCAQAIDAKFVVIVSAKADVKDEWEKTILSHIGLNHKSNPESGYYFLTRNDLERNENAIQVALNDGGRAAVFLTLQYLQNEDTLNRIKDVFGNNIIDLLIVDETHFGARGERYGAAIRNVSDVEANAVAAEADYEADYDDFEDVDAADKTMNALNRRVTLHLSGTPYRILLNDNEFEKDDIISFVQYSDIIREQEEWDKNNAEKLLTGEKKEWDNPYYGFPQMIRFAFNLKKSSRIRLEELKTRGMTADLSELFYPRSITRDNEGKHKKFAHRKEVLDLLKVIDGSEEDDELMGFLDYDGFKKGEMCRHIVMVLPYRASCDAMAQLIKVENKKKTFNNIKDYNILNISGYECPPEYNTVDGVKNAIKSFEEQGKKTITLTVDRMLTGSTVEEWDTMFFMKGTKSPQEYDQAIFRLQNKYVKDVVEEKKGSSDADDALSAEPPVIMKRNMKPQTLLVDFDPTRMFVMQERRAQICGMYSDEAGNDNLQERIKNELDVSPIIRLNANKLTKIDAVDIMEAVSEYNNDKGIMDEALDISVDLGILKDPKVLEAMRNEGEIGTKGSLKVRPAQNEPQGQEGNIDIVDEQRDENDADVENNGGDVRADVAEDERSHFVKKIQNYYARILLYAFITDDKVKSLKEVIDSLNADNSDNRRIVRNLGLDENVLESFHTYYSNNNRAILSELDYKIMDMNGLSHNENSGLSPVDRSEILLKKLKKLDDAIVVTPSKTCNDMVNMIPRDELIKILKGEDGYNCMVLDPASVAGEFAAAVVNFYTNLSYEEKQDISKDNIENCAYSIPKSSVCYELTLKMYKMLGLNTDNIATKFDSFDLIDLKKLYNIPEGGRIGNRNKLVRERHNKIREILTQSKNLNEISLDDEVDEGAKEKMKYDIVIGNPPYQVKDGGAQASSTSIYPLFFDIAKNLNPKYISMIIPSRWMTGGKGLDDFRDAMIHDRHITKLVDYANSGVCFSGVDIKGGVCYLLWERDRENRCEICLKTNSKEIKSKRFLFNKNDDVHIRYPQLVSIKNKVASRNEHSFEDIVSARKPYGLASNFFADQNNRRGNGIQSISDVPISDGYMIVGLDGKNNRVKKYMSKDYPLSKRDGLNDYKLFITRNYGVGEIGEIPSNSILAGRGVLCTETFLQVGPWDTREEAENALSYMNTKFFRCLVGIRKQTQQAPKEVYRYVPIQDFSKPWTDEELYEKYKLTDKEKKFIDEIMQPVRQNPQILMLKQ